MSGSTSPRRRARWEREPASCAGGIQPFSLTGQRCWTQAQREDVTALGAEIHALRVALAAALKNAPSVAELAA